MSEVPAEWAFSRILIQRKEELHLPALLVDLRDGQSGQRKVIGQKFQALAGDGVEVTHKAKGVRTG
jgi:hypothetical protein